MGFSNEQLNDIYDKTNGYCEYCGKKIAFKNYGVVGERGAWEVDHSNPKSRGGTDYLRNLFPACIDCNRDKGDRTGQSYRSTFSNSRPRATEPSIGEIIVGAGMPDQSQTGGFAKRQSKLDAGNAVHQRFVNVFYRLDKMTHAQNKIYRFGLFNYDDAQFHAVVLLLITSVACLLA